MNDDKVKFVELSFIVPLTIDFGDWYFEDYREEHAKLKWHRTKDDLESINH